MRIDFTAENKSKDSSQFPKFMLEKDESARVCILEAPILKYVHVLRAPIVNPVTGEQEKIEKKTAKGEVYETDAFEFVAQAVCTGDYAKVRESEIDPDNCPACADVAQHPDRFNAPEAKYVCHIVRYKTQPGTVQPQSPFQAELLLWVLTQRKFDKIVNIAAEFGDPRKIDLQVGPCNSKQYQNYEMAACHGEAVWGYDEQKKAFVAQLWETNAADEQQMSDTVARPLSPTRYSADAAKVNDRYEMIGRPQASQGPLGMEFGGLVQGSQQAAQLAEQPAPWSQQGPPSFAQQPQEVQQPAQAQQPQESPFQVPPFGAPAQAQQPQETQQQQPPSFAQQPVQQPQEIQQPAQQPQETQQPAQQPAQGGGTMDFNSLMNALGGSGQ